MALALTVPPRSPALLLFSVYVEKFVKATVESGQLSFQNLTKLSEAFPALVNEASPLAKEESLTKDAKQEKEVLGWLDQAESFQANEASLKKLNDALLSKTFLVGNTLTAADVAIFASLHPYIAQAKHADLLKFPAVTRHFDLVQNTDSVASVLASKHILEPNPISIDLDNVPKIERKAEPKPDKKKAAAAAAAATTSAAGAQPAASETKAEKTEAQGQAKPAGGKKPKKEGEAKPKKEKTPAPPAADAGPPMPWMVDLRVGRIVDVKKHPDADSLYVEQIDVGEAEPRTVVSGLVNYIPIEEMQNKVLICVCNLKPANMRGIKSFAMVLAATSKDGKTGQGSVELVQPPEGSQPGDRVYFEGFESEKALELLNPKKKVFETVQPGFTTLETREAAWVDPTDATKVHKIRTEKGACKAPNFVGASLS